MPVLQPLELWQKTGRDKAFGKGLFVLYDRREYGLCLGPTHIEKGLYLLYYCWQTIKFKEGN